VEYTHLSTAASVANQKLIVYYDILSNLAIYATVLDPRLNISIYELPERTKAQNTTQLNSAKTEVLYYCYKPNAPVAPAAVAIPIIFERGTSGFFFNIRGQ
jgi:hypothetical protein